MKRATGETGPRRRGLEITMVRLVMVGGLPAVATALWLLWRGDIAIEIRWTLGALILACWIGAAAAAYHQTIRPLQLLVNLLGALREGDYSLRGAAARTGSVLGSVMLEVNALGETLHRQRLSAVEAMALLSNVLSEIDVAIFAFDERDRLRLVNRAGADLLGNASADLVGRIADEIGMRDYLRGEAPRVFERTFAGGRGRWELRRSDFRQDGRPHRLVVLADLSRALREEERQAWQRIVRVLSHEINNSLTPIQSITRSVKRIVERELAANPRAGEVREGLDIVGNRAESLGRLMSEYARLARMPRPVLRPLGVAELVRAVADLERRVPVRVRAPADEPPARTTTGNGGRRVAAAELILGDQPQLEQVLINLVRNAADASLETGGEVTLSWRSEADHVAIFIDDEGPGIDQTGNLFVPFFTTKPHGSGIGLVLCRQIAEAHDGTVSLENHRDGKGARATLRLPRVTSLEADR